MQTEPIVSFNPDTASAFLAVIGNSIRLRTLIALSAGESDVGSLAAELHIAQSAISQHLGKLKDADLVPSRRDGKRIVYSLYDRRVLTTLWMLETMFPDH